MPSKYSIAVLPFANMSPEKENDYFSDGITEEIINALSKIDGLHVTARTSSFAFKNRNIDIREIGRRLNVSLLLEGSVRRSGSQVRVTTQLVKADDGFHIWSESRDRELKDIFILQDEIAAIIAGKIRTDLKPESVGEKSSIENTETLDLYLQGMHLLKTWNFKESDKAIACFKKALEIDPAFVKAYIGLSNCYTWLGSTGVMSPADSRNEVQYYINKTQKYSQDIPEVYQAIAGRSFWIDRNFPLALENINKALALQPSYSDALLYKGLILAASGDIEAGLDSLFQAERLDPVSDAVNYCIGLVYSFTGDDLKSLEYMDRNIKICPYWYAQYQTKAEVLCRLGRFDEAHQIIRMLEADPNSPIQIAELKGYYYASMGKKNEAYEQIFNIESDIKTKALQSTPSSSFVSSIFLKLGDSEKALDYLEYGLEHNATPFLFIKIDSAWDEFKGHPRYVNALKNIKYCIDETELTKPVRKYKKSGLSAGNTEMIEKRLKKLMKLERPYLNPELTLSDIAEAVDISANQLSQFLNEYAGRNYYDYVNSFRLEYFLNLIKNPENKNESLLSMAYDSGFNSKTTFNSFFKKTLGKTPSEYLKISGTE